MFSKLILLSLLPLCLFTSCEKIAPAKPCPPITEADCQNLHEQKLLDFEKEEGYQLKDPALYVFEDNVMLRASRMEASPSVYDEFPGPEGRVVGTTYVRPKSKAAQAEIKEGVYQMVLVPAKGSNEFVELQLKQGRAAVNKFQVGHVMQPGPHEIGPGDGPCVTGKRCPDVAQRARIYYQPLANANCKIYRVKVNCQLFVQAMGWCFWRTNEVVITPNNGNCSPPFTTATVNAGNWF